MHKTCPWCQRDIQLHWMRLLWAGKCPFCAKPLYWGALKTPPVYWLLFAIPAIGIVLLFAKTLSRFLGNVICGMVVLVIVMAACFVAKSRAPLSQSPPSGPPYLNRWAGLFFTVGYSTLALGQIWKAASDILLLIGLLAILLGSIFAVAAWGEQRDAKHL